MHTRDKTLQTHKLEEGLSGLTEEGRQCWLDEAGWEWRTRQKKQTVPSKGLPLYKGLKWMSGPSSPPQAHFPCPPDIIVHQPASNWSCDWMHSSNMKTMVCLTLPEQCVSYGVARSCTELCLKREAIFISTLCLVSLYFCSLSVDTSSHLQSSITCH